MKYIISAGDHPARIEITDGDRFTGTITHTERGDGTITDGVRAGKTLTGKVHIAGHTAVFNVDGEKIAGSIRVIVWGWPMESTDFTGSAVA
jgi:hypothetical protein